MHHEAYKHLLVRSQKRCLRLEKNCPKGEVSIAELVCQAVDAYLSRKESWKIRAGCSTRMHYRPARPSPQVHEPREYCFRGDGRLLECTPPLYLSKSERDVLVMGNFLIQKQVFGSVECNGRMSG